MTLKNCPPGYGCEETDIHLMNILKKAFFGQFHLSPNYRRCTPAHPNTYCVMCNKRLKERKFQVCCGVIHRMSVSFPHWHLDSYEPITAESAGKLYTVMSDIDLHEKTKVLIQMPEGFRYIFEKYDLMKI